MANVEKMHNAVRVAAVDHDEDIHLCLKGLFQFSIHFSFVGSFSNATEALNGLPNLRPDLALMDVRLPDLNGIECARRLKQSMPHLKIVMITGTHEKNWVSASRKAGATAYLVKPFIEEQLLATLGFVSTSPASSTRSLRKKDENIHDLPAQLNAREREVLRNLAEGLLYKEISDKLGISYAAVHKCQHNIFKKLHVSNRSEAARVWFEGVDR
jgi:DNA-binding NarL/FixJ family response regulator